jgi:polygalacturonase
MPRLPSVGQDADAWSSILNAFLRVAHQDDGTLKDVIAVHNVQDPAFGALGDGQADDTDAIQAAIDAAARPRSLLTFGGAPVIMGGTVDQVSHTTTGVAGGWTAQVVVDSASYALSAV